MFVEALCSINSGQADKGDILDLCADEARSLIKAGAAREVSREEATKKLESPREVVEETVAEREAARANAGSTGGGNSSDDEAKKRKAEVIEAIKMILESGENLTQDGKPEVKAIKDIVGYDISAQERDSLVEELEEEEEE